MLNNLQSTINKKNIVLLVMWMTALGQAAIAIYLPSFPEISTQLNITPSLMKGTISVFLFGFGISQLFYGLLSDRFGRKPILQIGLGIFCFGCLMNIICWSKEIFFIARFIQGFGSGAVLVNSRSILRDCFSGREFFSAASYSSMGFAIGFGFSPIIGAYLSSIFNWKASFVFLFFYAILLVLFIWKYLPETKVKVQSTTNTKSYLLIELKNYGSIIANHKFLSFLFCGIFAYSVIISYNVMTPFLIQNKLEYSSKSYALLAMLLSIPYYLAAVFNRKFVLKYGVDIIFFLGISLIILSGIMMGITFLIFNLNLIFIIASYTLAIFGQSLIFSNAIAGALHTFPAEIAGKVSAILCCIQMILTAFISALMSIIPDTNQLSLALVLIVLGLFSKLSLIDHSYFIKSLPKFFLKNESNDK